MLKRTNSSELYRQYLTLIPVVFRNILLPIIFGLFVIEGCKRPAPQTSTNLSPLKTNKLFSEADAQRWADSVLNTLSTKEKVGQLFMVAAYSNRDEKHTADILKLVKEEKIGGLIFFQGGPVRQAQLTNLYQSNAKVPLMIGMDAEWGLGMRLDSTISFPKQMTLGAIQNNELIYDMGEMVAQHCKRLGVHVNFAPVVDVNVNPSNPIIGVRSFGENKDSVAVKGIAYMKGLQDQHVMANAKHFPGHGDTDMDSHLSLPVIPHDKERLANVEQYPFKKLIAAGLKSIMVAHVHMPAYDNRKNQATTLSEAVVTDLLKNELSFRGLVFTDALNMKGVASYYDPGEVDLEAFMAGNDVLLFSENVPLASEKILHAIKKHKISIGELDARVKKILLGKYWCGLGGYEPIETKGLIDDLNSADAIALNEKLYQESFVCLSTEINHLIPTSFDKVKIASVVISNDNTDLYQKYLDKYTYIDHFKIGEQATKNSFDSLYKLIDSKYDLTLVSLQKSTARKRNTFRFSPEAVEFVLNLSATNPSIISVLANPYTLADFQSRKNIIYGPVSNEITQKILPQILFGATGTTGKLPVTTGEVHKAGDGVVLKSKQRLGYSLPELVGMDSESLQLVDSIAQEAVTDSATPGCYVLVARGGKVVYSKGFGYYTYEKKKPVTENTIYDLASVTKIVSALPAFMFLEERREVDIDKRMSDYLADLKGTNKEDMLIKDILTHQAGLVGYLQHWKNTEDEGELSERYYCTWQKDSLYCNVLVPGLYTLTTMEDSLWLWTRDSKLLRLGRGEKTYGYKYSDLAFYMVKRVVEKLISQELNEFVTQNFYRPLGLKTLGYNPTFNHSLQEIAPTEFDSTYRRRLIWGTVHDQGAAMMGGVAGHAGVFSNAEDLAKMLQMYLNMGTYGGQKYFNEETIKKFSARQFDGNRRGLGFDKPEIESGGPTSQLASSSTFGHSGFTGIGAWVDPKFDLIYIFLSNRVHPVAENRKLIEYNIRTRIHDAIYESVFEYEKKKKN